MCSHPPLRCVPCWLPSPQPSRAHPAPASGHGPSIVRGSGRSLSRAPRSWTSHRATCSPGGVEKLRRARSSGRRWRRAAGRGRGGRRLRRPSPLRRGRWEVRCGLRYVEDGLGWESARARQVIVPDGVVIEIAGPRDWAALCARHPLVVTASRGHDWGRFTDQRGPWVQPDWASVANEAVGVHLSVAGYLSTAGRVIPVGALGSSLWPAGRRARRTGSSRSTRSATKSAGPGMATRGPGIPPEPSPVWRARGVGR